MNRLGEAQSSRHTHHARLCEKATLAPRCLGMREHSAFYLARHANVQKSVSPNCRGWPTSEYWRRQLFSRYRMWHVRDNSVHSLKHDLGDVVGSHLMSAYINWGTRNPRNVAATLLHPSRCLPIRTPRRLRQKLARLTSLWSRSTRTKTLVLPRLHRHLLTTSQRKKDLLPLSGVKSDAGSVTTHTMSETPC